MQPDRAGRRTWIALGIILLIALSMRLGFVLTAARPQGFRAIDPDGYAQDALKLVPRDHQWRWTTQVVRFGRFTKPPLYPVLLSFFVVVSPSSYPLSAAVGHAVAGAATVLLVFWIGRTIHSNRAGLIGAALLAVYFPPIIGSWVFYQENFYIPFATLGLALLTRAVVANAPPTTWAVAGLVMGAAALIRSMPLYFVVPATVLHVGLAAERRAAARQVLGLFLGLSLLVVPYSAYISTTVGQFVLIENMATIRVRMIYPHDEVTPIHYAPAPGLLQAAGMFLRGFAERPLEFVGTQADRAKGMFQLRGGRYLQSRMGVATAEEARRLKTVTHLGYDVPFAIAALLAPVGWALARARPGASVLLVWVVVNIGLITAAGMSGARYRAPMEPALFALAAVVLAGGWRKLSRWSGVAAVGCTLLVALAVAASIPATARGRAEYGLRDRTADATWTAWTSGDAGFNVLTTPDGALQFSVTARATGSSTPVPVDVLVEGAQSQRLTLTPGETQIVRHRASGPGLTFVELRTVSGDRPAILDISCTGEPH